MSQDLISETTQELTDFIKDYQGKLEYGNLRNHRGIMNRFRDEFNWALAYDILGGSSSQVELIYNETTGIWECREKEYKMREDAVASFKESVKDIPEERREKLRQWFEKGNTLDQLAAQICSNDLRKYYTRDEIEFIQTLSDFWE